MTALILRAAPVLESTKQVSAAREQRPPPPSAPNATQKPLIRTDPRCSRSTIYRYMERYPELKEHCAEVLAMLCDNARSNVYEDVAYQKNVRTSIRVLEQNDPAWRNKQTVEHTGTLNLTAGLMSKDDIAKMSNDDIQKLITVRKAVRQWTFECL